MNTCKLFCLPYAGGSSLIFSDWKLALNRHIEIIPIELKGRGQRYHEGFYQNIPEAAHDIINEMDAHVDIETPYFLFGQSVGGLIIYEILTLLYQRKRHLPFHVFFSAIFPPHINKIQTKLHELSDHAFIKKLQRWGSLPAFITKDMEMLKTWTPILKADYGLLENYHFSPQAFELPIDFTILKGKEDHWLSKEEYHEWDRYTNREIEFHEIQGGHLFIHEQKQEVISIINKTVEAYV